MNPTRFSFHRPLVTSLLMLSLILFTSLTLLSQDRRERTAREAPQRSGTLQRSANVAVQEHGFVTLADNGKSICRDMSNEEVGRIKRDVEQIRHLRVITQREREAVLGRQLEVTTEAAGLKITLRSTTQLDGFPEAKAAFIRAAAAWEAQIKNPISIIVDVDFGPMRFGQTYPANVLGSTSTPSYRVSYDTTRARLLSSAASSAETTLYNALPTGNVLTELGFINEVSIASPLTRALSILPSDATSSDPAPQIGFNSAFSFDFDPSDGIASGKTDFDAVAVHEMGHALGFISNVGSFELFPLAPKTMTVWDLFRFRPGTTMATFTSALRALLSGGEQRFYDGNPELATSTGKPDGTGGDGRQASHWKADELSGVYIGIMDPTLSAGMRKTMTSNDLQMLESIGYQISGTVQPPCTLTLSATNASATTAGGNGTVGVTASDSICDWTATSNAAWISVTSGANGMGNGTVGYSVQANTGASRSGTITIAGQTFTINQDGCSFTLSYTTNSFPAEGSTGSVTVTASAANCTWTAGSNSSWLSITSGSSGTGNGTVNYSVAANPNTTSRTGSLTIAGRSFSVTQAGQTPSCSYTVGSFGTNFQTSGGVVLIPVTTASNCTWNVSTNASWVSLFPSTSFTGSANVILLVGYKTTPGTRTATVTIAGQNFTITQN
jgi:hypothetical protein